MVRLNGSELARLQVRTSHFSSSSHLRYIAEALQNTRISQNPVEALELLYAMWGTAYAKTPHEKKALNDVGTWFERRLVDEPAVDATRIALELAWAARLTRIAEAQASVKRDETANRASQDHRNRGGPHQRSAEGLLFGRHIAAIKQRRVNMLRSREVQADAEAQRNVRETLPRAKPAVVEVPPPTSLPPFFEAEFINFSDARDAFHAARTREKAKKPPKERFLPIRPVDGRLRPLASNLVCSTLLPGFKGLFDAISATGGAERTFYIQGISEAQDKRMVIDLLLTPPATNVNAS